MKKNILIITILFSCILTSNAQYTDIYDFQSQPDGAYPHGSLVRSGNKFYGLSNSGGVNNDGNIYSITANDTNYIPSVNWSYSFGIPTDGNYPTSPLIRVGGKFYGTTVYGGTFSNGTIFSIDTDGTNYQIFYHFGTSFNDGQNPYGSLTSINSKLYGMASGGGNNSYGMIFSIDTSGSNYIDLYDFTASYDDANPHGALTNVGGVLYGMTTGVSYGNIFSIDTDGTNYNNLHQFNDTTDGANPAGSLTYHNGLLYGMTANGGNDTILGVAVNGGTIFTIDPTGNNFHVIMTFQGRLGNSNYGSNPAGSLLIEGNIMYGTTQNGGKNDSLHYGGYGDIFSVHTDGTGYRSLHIFNTSDGMEPMGDVTKINGILYAGTPQGGPANTGNIVCVDTSGNNFRDVIDFTNIVGPYWGDGVFSSLTYTNGKLYGISPLGGSTFGGISGSGVVFSVDPASVDTMVSGFKLLHVFGPTGGAPNGNLTFSKDSAWLFGMTAQGGKYGNGNIFKIDTTGNNYTSLYDFQDVPDGKNPQGSLTLSPDGLSLYGMTQAGGSTGNGSVFQIHTDGTSYKTIYSFPTPTVGYGAQPTGDLIFSKDSSLLYGETVNGGVYGNGILFSITIDSTHIFHDLYDFVDQVSSPNGSLTLSPSGDTLYGATFGGGANYAGTIFLYKIPSHTLQFFYQFSTNGTTGSYPLGPLTYTADKSSLLGISTGGGANSFGNIFRLHLNNAAYEDIYDFTNINQAANAPLLLVDSFLYGASGNGGANGFGYIFNYRIPATNAVFSVVNQNICPRDSFGFAGSYYQLAGTYFDTLAHAAIGGLDSIIQLNLLVYPEPGPFQIDFDTLLCPGIDTFYFNGHKYIAGGPYHDTIPGIAQHGCDSIINFKVGHRSIPQNIILRNGDTTLLEANLFAGYQWYLNGNIISSDTTQRITIDQNGLYSVYVTSVFCPVRDTSFLVNWIPTRSLTSDSICYGTSVHFNGFVYSTAGTYIDTLVGGNSNGFDSIATLNLFVASQVQPHIQQHGTEQRYLQRTESGL